MRVRVSRGMAVSAVLAALLLLAVASPLAIAQSQAPQTCSLYGPSSYQSDWITINVIVVLLGISVTAVIYSVSKALPSRPSSLISSITKVEFFQLMLSLIIIGVLIAVSTMACNATTSFTQQLTGKQMVPFQYAEYYVSNLSLNTGLKLLTFLYTNSITYMMDAMVMSKLSSQMPQFNRQFPRTGSLPIQVSIAGDTEFGAPYSILSSFYLSLFATTIVTAIGMLFIQFLILPIIEAVAFTVLLPTALILRSIAYAGGRRDSLRHASNAFLSLAIALYLVYPATIALDGYVTGWIYSAQNPLYQYLSPTMTVYQIPATLFSSMQSATTGQETHILSIAPSVMQVFNSFVKYGLPALNPFSVPADAITIISDGAQFMFVAVVLFAFNSAVTIAFAQSLANALNAGITGPVPFWSNL